MWTSTGGSGSSCVEALTDVFPHHKLTASAATIAAGLRGSRATGNPRFLQRIVAGSGPLGNQLVVRRGFGATQALGPTKMIAEGTVHVGAAVGLSGCWTEHAPRHMPDKPNSVIFFCRLGCRHFMDPSGRFDFWRMLIHTRAITPPRVALKLWSQVVKQAWVGWWALGAIAALSVAAAFRLGGSDLPSQSAANSPPSPIVASPSPAKPHLRW
jgi:hypothetical protein